MLKVRIDVFLTENGYVKSRERAKNLIKAGQVTANNVIVLKPSYDVTDGTEITITGEQLKYVGRGGLKLEKAIEHFNLNLENRICLDIGASTGGFTDCMLQNGAAYVYAVDVGHDQLDETLVNDKRVKSMERTNILDLTLDDFIPNPSFIATDVSFVSLKQILPKIKELLPDNGEAAVLIKPQFEAGKSAIGKNGIVKDKKVHEKVLTDIISFCFSQQLEAVNLIHSPISGGDGNIEYLLHLKIGIQSHIFDYKKIVSAAFDELK